MNFVFTWNTYCENCTSSNGYISNAKTESQEHYNHHHHHKKLIDVVKEVRHSSSKDKSNNHGCNKPSSRHLATSSQLTFKDSSTNANSSSSKLGRIQSRHRENNTEVTTMKLKIVLLLFVYRPITALWGVVWLARFVINNETFFVQLWRATIVIIAFFFAILPKFHFFGPP